MVTLGWVGRFVGRVGRAFLFAPSGSDRGWQTVGLILRAAAVCWVVVFWRLGYLELFDDGAHYAQLTREMIQQGSWLVPMLDGQPFLDKPVLFHWLQRAAFSLAGESEAAARLPSAVAAVALFFVTRWISLALWGPPVASRAWLMLATMPATFALARIAYLDMVFSLFTFGGVACLIGAAQGRRPRLVHAASLLLGLAVMTKGPVALALVALFLALGWLAGGETRRALSRLNARSLALGAVIGSAPWFLWMYWQFGDGFVRTYLIDGHLFYLAPRESASSARPGFYLQMFLTAFFPWSLLAIGYAVDTVRAWRRGTRPAVEDVLLWSWLAAVVLLFSLVQFRVDRYIYPAAPACCMLAARGWVAARDPVKSPAYLATRVAVVLFAVVLVTAGVMLAVALPGLELRASSLAFALPVALVAGGTLVVVSMIFGRFTPPALTTTPLAVMLAIYATVVGVGFPAMDQMQPMRRVAAWLEREVPDGDVALYDLDRWREGLRYYATRPLHTLSDPDAAIAFLRGTTNAIVMRRHQYLALRDRGFAGKVRLALPAVRGTEGGAIRRQIWGEIYVVTRGPD